MEPYADLGQELGLGLNELGRTVSLFLSVELQFSFEDYCGLGLSPLVWLSGVSPLAMVVSHSQA